MKPREKRDCAGGLPADEGRGNLGRETVSELGAYICTQLIFYFP